MQTDYFITAKTTERWRELTSTRFYRRLITQAVPRLRDRATSMPRYG